jgi:tripartite ATP-independent transporter DctM subunit
MTSIEIGSASLVLMLVLIYAGMHVGVALTLLSFVGVWLIRDNFTIASRLLATSAYESINNHFFGVVPLFVLMGLLVSVADIGRDTFAVADQFFKRIRGGLGIATVAANAVFAAITGISIASAAVFTKVAVPEMLRLGYTPRFSVGVVAGSSVLGMLIPPSLLLIVYAFLAEQSVGDMFLAGVLPGIVLALAYAVAILFMAYRMPGFVGGTAQTAKDDGSAMTGIQMLARMAPIAVLVVMVLGGIYSGFFTPTEAGAVGALGALILAIARRKLTWKSLWQVLVETGHITVSICFLIIAASIYTRMLAMSGLPQSLVSWIGDSGLGLWGLIPAVLVVILLMGTVLDSTSIMLIVLPLVLPVLGGYDVNLVWFGIVTIVAVEIGLLTPPLGIAVYVIKSTLDDPRITLGDIFRGAFPFAVIMLMVLGLIVAFPQLSLALL